MEFLKRLWSLVGKYARDERGEIGPDISAEDKDKGGGEVDFKLEDFDVYTGETGEISEEVTETDDEKAARVEREAAGDKKDDKKVEDSDDVKAIKAENERLKNHNKDLNKALHDKRLERKAAKTDDAPPLTDAQLLTILQENKDDPKTILQVTKYMAEQAAKGAKKETLNEAEVIARKKSADTALKSIFKEAWDDEGSDVRLSVEKAKTELGLEDHPMGDLAAAAILTMNDMPRLQKQWFEAGKEAALKETGKGNADDKRKEKIKDNQAGGTKTVKTTKTSSGLTPGQLDVAKRLRFTTPEQLKRYAQIVGGGNKEE